MSIGTVVGRKLAALIFGVIAVFRRLLCFLNIKRNRKNSGSILPMTIDPVLAGGGEVQQSLPTNSTNELEMESWDSWGTEVKSSGGGGGGYTSSAPTEPDPEDIDYFQDMRPTFVRPKKVIIKKNEERMDQHNGPSRLSMAPAVSAPVGAELEAWDDADGSAWSGEVDEDLSWQADQAIRDKKRLERESRQQEQLKRKQLREQSRTVKREGQLTAVKLS